MAVSSTWPGYNLSFEGTGADIVTFHMRVDSQGDTAGALTDTTARGSISGSFTVVGGQLYLHGDPYMALFLPFTPTTNSWAHLTIPPTAPILALSSMNGILACMEDGLGAISFSRTSTSSTTVTLSAIKPPPGENATLSYAGDRLVGLSWTTQGVSLSGCPGSDVPLPLMAPLRGTFTIVPAAVGRILAPSGAVNLTG